MTEYIEEPEPETDEQKYGKILSVEITNYWKYTFSLTLTTEKGKVMIETGGTADDIYRYNPYSLDWDEHDGTTMHLWSFEPNE
jgi:hypothetical protein